MSKMETKEQILNRSAEMDVWLRKIDDHCEYVIYHGVHVEELNKLNLAEEIVNEIEDAVRYDRENQHDNAITALKSVVREIEKTVLYYQNSQNCYFLSDLLVKSRKIIADTYGEL